MFATLPPDSPRLKHSLPPSSEEEGVAKRTRLAKRVEQLGIEAPRILMRLSSREDPSSPAGLPSPLGEDTFACEPKTSTDLPSDKKRKSRMKTDEAEALKILWVRPKSGLQTKGEPSASEKINLALEAYDKYQSENPPSGALGLGGQFHELYSACQRGDLDRVVKLLMRR